MKNILITGGFGFLGSHLIEEIHSNEPDALITVVDNLSTSPIDLQLYLKELNDPRWLSSKIMDLSEYLSSFDDKHDEIYHLASVVGPAGVLPHAGKIVGSIVSDTYGVMEVAKKWGAKIVDVSTSEVYGGGVDGYCSEDTAKVVPATTTVRLEYAIAKLASETALINSGANAVIIRPFNIAGQRQSGKGGFVLPRFIEQAVNNDPLTVFGDGSQVRAFTYVKDVTHGIWLAMEKGEAGEAYNIGNPDNKTTIKDLAKRVISLSNSESKIKYVDPRTIYGKRYAEANSKFPDATRAKTELGWNPTKGIDEIIKITLEYMK